MTSTALNSTQISSQFYGVDTGGDDTYVVALTPALTVYTTIEG